MKREELQKLITDFYNDNCYNEEYVNPDTQNWNYLKISRFLNVNRRTLMKYLKPFEKEIVITERFDKLMNLYADLKDYLVVAGIKSKQDFIDMYRNDDRARLSVKYKYGLLDPWYIEDDYLTSFEIFEIKREKLQIWFEEVGKKDEQVYTIFLKLKNTFEVDNWDFYGFEAIYQESAKIQKILENKYKIENPWE